MSLWLTKTLLTDKLIMNLIQQNHGKLLFRYGQECYSLTA